MAYRPLYPLSGHQITTLPQPRSFWSPCQALAESRQVQRSTLLGVTGRTLGKGLVSLKGQPIRRNPYHHTPCTVSPWPSFPPLLLLEPSPELSHYKQHTPSHAQLLPLLRPLLRHPSELLLPGVTLRREAGSPLTPQKKKLGVAWGGSPWLLSDLCCSTLFPKHPAPLGFRLTGYTSPCDYYPPASRPLLTH